MTEDGGCFIHNFPIYVSPPTDNVTGGFCAMTKDLHRWQALMVEACC